MFWFFIYNLHLYQYTVVSFGDIRCHIYLLYGDIIADGLSEIWFNNRAISRCRFILRTQCPISYSRWICLREIAKRGTMHVELCASIHSSMQPAANSKSFAHIVSSDCSISNIFWLITNHFPDISSNTTLQLSTTALPLSAEITIYKSSTTHFIKFCPVAILSALCKALLGNDIRSILVVLAIQPKQKASSTASRYQNVVL